MNNDHASYRASFPRAAANFLSFNAVTRRLYRNTNLDAKSAMRMIEGSSHGSSNSERELRMRLRGKRSRKIGTMRMTLVGQLGN